MRYQILFPTVVLIIVSAFGQQNNTVPLKSHSDSVSYIIGRDVGEQIKEFGADINLPPFQMGVQQALKGTKSPIDSSTADSLRSSFASEVRENMQQEQQALADSNKKASDEFLTQNKNREGIKTTKSGLQYKVLKNGTGPKPSSNDSVQILYKGMLLDSTVIDSTTDSNPAVLDLQKTIPGISEGIQMMNVGSSYRFFLPPDLAYGSTGAPPDIPPNATLIFDVTLQKILGQSKAAEFSTK